MLNKFLPFLVICLLAVVLVSLWFKDGYIMGTAEGGIPFYDLGRYYDVTKDAWTDIGLGNSTSTIAASKLAHGSLHLLELIGIPNFIIQAMFFFFILVLSGTGVYLLSKEILGKVNDWMILLGVVFYWFNPISLVNVWNRFLTNHFVYFAFLPIALFIFMRGLRRRDWKYCIYLGLSSVIFSYVFISPAFIISLWGLFLYTSLFMFFLDRKTFKVLLFYLSYYVISAVVFVLFNFWWILQLVAYYFSNSYEASAASFFSSRGNEFILSYLSDQLGQFAYVLRFMHGGFFEIEAFWRQIYIFWPVVIMEFLILGLILYAIYRGRRIKRVLFLGSVFVLTVLLLKGNGYPFGEVYQFLFIKLPILQVFRNPFEKLGFLLLLSGSILFVFALDVLNRSFLVRKVKRFIVFMVAVFIVGVWGFPYWSGFLFTSEYPPANKMEIGYKVDVPNEYKDVDGWFKKQEGDYRILVLPIGDEGITHIWEKGYTGIDVTYALLSKPVISFNTTIPNYHELVEEIKNHQLSDDVLDYAKFINAQYIVWRGDVDFKERGMADPKSIKDRLEMWSLKGLIEKQYEKGQLSVYKINQKYIWPKIYTTSNVLFSNETDLVKLSKLLNIDQKDRYSVLKPNDRQVMSNAPQVIAPGTVFSPMEVGDKNLLSDADLLAELYFVRHLPGSNLNYLVRVKELLQTPPQSDHWQWIHYKVALLGKRVAEMYKLWGSSSRLDLMDKLEDEYLAELIRVESEIQGVLTNQGSVGFIVENSLYYQFLLLRRMDSRLYPKLEKSLVELKIKPQFDLPDTDGVNTLVYRYQIPEDGVYRIWTDALNKSATLYLDGKELPGINVINGYELRLSEGVHEVAFVQNKSESNVILAEDELNIDQNSSWMRNIYFDVFPGEYRLEFDYLFKKGDMFKLNLIQNTDKVSDKRLVIVKDGFDHTQRHFGESFQSIKGAVSADLSVGKIFKTKCERKYVVFSYCFKELNKFSAQIRNFRLTKLEHPLILFAVGEPERASQQTSRVEFRKINPTLYEVNIKKNTDQMEVIVFSEMFNTGWELINKDTGEVAAYRHLLVNDYANGWVFDQIGEHNFLIQFSPQKHLLLAQWISGVSIVVGVVFLFTQKRHENI